MLRPMKTVATLLWVCCAVALGEDAPRMMTKLTVKLQSPEIQKESFAAQSKLIYRAASGYCRIEENPDLEHAIHGLLITNEPDVWMVNRLDRTARHIVDPGPTYNCLLPMFVNGQDIKSAEDLSDHGHRRSGQVAAEGRGNGFGRQRCRVGGCGDAGQA